MNIDALSKSRLSKTLAAETSDLRRAWAGHSSTFLDSYLVQDVEDPRINIQSILTRHFLIRQIFHDYDCDHLTKHEMYYALTVNWLLDLIKSPILWHEINDRMNVIFETLLGHNDTDPSDVPKFLNDAFRQLSFPNYISDLLSWVPQKDSEEKIPDYLLNTFQDIWVQTLDPEKAASISVIEPACGSANDYRFFDSFGLARFLRYAGFDLSKNNISNAKAMYPSVDFRVDNIFEIPVCDKSFEYCFVHDLLEHLSVEGVERAIREICRVTSKKICIHFFNMEESDEHQVKKNGDYHLNRLSRKQMHCLFQNNAEKIETIHIDTFLKKQFGYSGTHNKQAWTWFIDLI